MKDILHIAHANGFNGGTYRVISECLAPYYDVHAIDRFGHNPEFPVTDNWPSLVNELVHYFETHFSRPVIAVGHSLGGVLSLMASYQRPDLVKAVIMLDSPVMPRWQAVGMRVLKSTRLNDRFFPILRTEARRTEWQDLDEAKAYFYSKSLMKRFDERCMDDYLRAGTEPFEGGVRLRFDPSTEANIWRTIPHHLHTLGRIKVPGAVIAGRQSEFYKPVNGMFMKGQLGMKLHWVPGRHLFPMEQPEMTAETLHKVIGDLLRGR